MRDVWAPAGSVGCGRGQWVVGKGVPEPLICRDLCPGRWFPGLLRFWLRLEEFGETGGDFCCPSGGFAFPLAANYLGWMVLTQREAPSSSSLLSPPSSWDQTGGGGSRGLLHAACRAIHHGECIYRPGARTQAEQVVPGRQWEEMGMYSPNTVFIRGPGLATEERSGACQVVDEMQGIPKAN